MSWHLLDVETGNVLCGNCTPARLAAGEAVLDDVDAVHLLADDPAVPLGIRKGALRLIDAEAHAGRTAADTVLRALSYLEATGGLDAVRAMLALPASEAPARTRRRTAA
jgi:hypothetical protein